MVHTLSLVPRHKLRHAKRAHFYIRFDVCASASRTDIKKLSAHNVCTQRSLWSEWRDLNSRPYGPEPYALPNCATPRYYKFAFTSTVASLGARRAFPLGLAFFTVDLKSYRILGISLVLFPLLSQTKLRYTPIIYCNADYENLTAFAIYNNWRIFATKTRHLSQNLSFATLFFIYDWQNRLQNVEH